MFLVFHINIEQNYISSTGNLLNSKVYAVVFLRPEISNLLEKQFFGYTDFGNLFIGKLLSYH